MPSNRQPITAITRHCGMLALLVLGSLGSATHSVHAGGGGQNMLLLVNPTDEPSLRIANAYVQARNIPTNNILFIDPSAGKGPVISIPSATFTTAYQIPILNAIAARGLTDQIDYIGTLGQPHSVLYPYSLGFHACLNHLTQLQNGMAFEEIIYRNSELFQDPPPFEGNGPMTYTPGANPAITHSRLWTPTGVTGTASTAQWYMSGMIGHSGLRGLNTTQVIQNLQRTVAGDGTRPQGTVYFEDNSNIHVTVRRTYWPGVQRYMDTVGIPWVQEYGLVTPKNRTDVRGAVVGTGTGYLSTAIVNGSAYLPGSWADNLTSYGGLYTDGTQSRSSNYLLAGAGGASGTVAEPQADIHRFPNAMIFLFSNDGSTLGEAFHKSVRRPDLIMFEGDLLSQAYADVPQVTFTAGPADGATVSGAISVSASAVLDQPRVATGIARLKLFVDGLQSGPEINDSSGSFNLDTTTLTDGVHELRIVATNNSQAASQGYSLRNIVVNNLNQSVAATGPAHYSATWNETLSIPVSASQGSGPAITGIQLQCLGRVVGEMSGLAGNVALDVTMLAFGDNSLVPVAVLSSGSAQVRGTSITVNRRFQKFPGTTPTPLAQQTPGADIYFFAGAAPLNSTLDTINFDATPSHTARRTTPSLSPVAFPAEYRPPEGVTLGYVYQDAVMLKTNVTITTAGEYLFSPSSGAYTSFGFWVNDTLVARKDHWNTSTNTWDVEDAPRSVYLLPGEHAITVKLGQSRFKISDSLAKFSFVWRGPDGNTNWTGAPAFYTVNKRLTSQ